MSHLRQPTPESPEPELLARCFGFTYPPGHSLATHAHRWDQLIYATGGVMKVIAEGGTWIVPPQRALWVPAGVQHAIVMSGRVAMRTLYLQPGLVADTHSGCRVVHVSPLLRELIVHIVRLGPIKKDEPRAVRVLNLVLDLFSELAGERLRLPLPTDPRGLAVAERLIENPAVHDPIEVLAREASASRRTVERIFNTETGMTVGQWRRQLRLFHALELLATGEPVMTVAFRVGYNSPSSFIARFKEAFGTTPGRYYNKAPVSSATSA